MASTRRALQEIAANVDESMGVRQVETKPLFGPMPSAKDAGRTPLRRFGRVEVSRITPDPMQPRTEFDEDEIELLAASIRSTGQLHPIRVRWDDELEMWVVVTGERRLRATKAAGLTHIDCFFHEDEITPSEILEQQLVENLLRQDLTPMEEARGFAALMELNRWNGKQVAEALRVSPSRVSRALALLDLPPDIQQAIEAGTIPRSSAYELTKLPNDAMRRSLAQQAAAGALTHSQTTRAVRQRKGKDKSKSRQIKLSFAAQEGVRITAVAPKNSTYYHIEAALEETLAEVRHRIRNNVQLF